MFRKVWSETYVPRNVQTKLQSRQRLNQKLCLKNKKNADRYKIYNFFFQEISIYSAECGRSLGPKMTGLSRSIKFRINPTNSAMFRAVFGHARGRIKKNTQHESCRVILHLQLFCWTIFEFTYEILREMHCKFQVQSYSVLTLNANSNVQSSF